jgi:hypothetical protein
MWGSVCSEGVNVEAVRIMCKSMNYLDGFKKNGDGADGEVCEKYMGENYCAPEPGRIHFMNMKCKGKEEDIMDCYRELAEKCDHK